MAVVPVVPVVLVAPVVSQIRGPCVAPRVRLTRFERRGSVGESRLWQRVFLAHQGTVQAPNAAMDASEVPLPATLGQVGALAGSLSDTRSSFLPFQVVLEAILLPPTHQHQPRAEHSQRQETRPTDRRPTDRPYVLVLSQEHSWTFTSPPTSFNTTTSPVTSLLRSPSRLSLTALAL